MTNEQSYYNSKRALVLRMRSVDRCGVDTIELTAQNLALSDETFKRACQVGKPSPFRDRDGRKTRLRPGFRRQVSVVIDGLSALVGHEAANSNFENSLFLKFDCTDHETFGDMKAWLYKNLGLNNERLTEMQVHRLDRCVNIAVPWETLSQAIYQKRLKSWWEVHSTRRMVYLGKSPFQTAVYEKWLPEPTIDWIPEGKKITKWQSDQVLATRVEVRTWGRKVPVKSFNEIPTLRNKNPFTHLNLGVLEQSVIDDLEFNQQKSVRAFCDLAKQYGAQEARAFWNRKTGGHFASQVGKYLKPLELDLMAAWESHCQRFFGKVANSEST